MKQEMMSKMICDMTLESPNRYKIITLFNIMKVSFAYRFYSFIDFNCCMRKAPYKDLWDFPIKLLLYIIAAIGHFSKEVLTYSHNRFM